MSTRKSASLDGSLLARKGDAAPAVPEPPLQLDAFGETPRRPSLLDPGVAAAPPPAPSADEAPRARRLVPMTKSGRGLVALASVALLAIVLMVTEELIAPADQVAEIPADPPRGAVPVSDKVPAPDGIDVVEKPAIPPEVSPGPEPLLLPASASAVEPEPAAPPASVRENDVAAAAVADAPPPPAVPVRKKPVVAKAAPANPPPAKPAVTSGPYILQFAAFTSATSAEGEAARLRKALGGVLGERRIVVVKAATAAKQSVWRLRASSYASFAAARAACDSIRKLRTGCLVIRR